MRAWSGVVVAAGVVLALRASVPYAQADSLQVKDGHYAGGPVTVLHLDAEQVNTARVARLVVLTAQQRRTLRAEAKIAPLVIALYRPEIAATTCADGEDNIAIWIVPDTIEVIHGYLARPEDRPRPQVTRGPTLRLTREQQETIGEASIIVLTPEQKQAVARKTGVAPSVLRVVEPTGFSETSPGHVTNFAVRSGPATVEVQGPLETDAEVQNRLWQEEQRMPRAGSPAD